VKKRPFGSAQGDGYAIGYCFSTSL
jgi:hypothetical protein